VLRTPLRHSAWLSAASGSNVALKLETLQPAFSFKIRGALNAVLRLVETGGPDLPPLVTASAGNHGRALAYAARQAGLPLTVYVPQAAPRVKLEAIRNEGAALRPCADYDEAERQAKAHGASGAALFISPYSHPDVIAGAGTVALEVLEDRPEIDAFVVPIGGGGLISGIAIAARALSPSSRVIGVEVEASSPFTASLAAGRIVEIEVGETIADGLSGNMDPDTITFDIVREHVDGIAVVSEVALRKSVGDLVREERLIAEPAAAAGVAAVVAKEADVRGRNVGVILSGANIDAEKLKALL
jgi:threonine dehydratase